MPEVFIGVFRPCFFAGGFVVTVGEDIARATAMYMEYPYTDSNARRIRL